MQIRSPLLIATTAFGLAGQVRAEAWTFGLIADTQWPATTTVKQTIKAHDGVTDSTISVTVNADSLSGYKNPNTVAADIAQQVDKEFIRRGVKFVVAVGDVTDNGSLAGLDSRATLAQELYNAGIGFYPLRGNHESSAAAAAEFTRIFPQTQDGSNNKTPSSAFNWTDSANLHLATAAGAPFTIGTGFSSPNAAVAGLTYGFQYRNTTIVLLDQFLAGNPIDSQQTWISSKLSGRPAGTHAFVFGHKGLVTENHTDNLFGNDPSQDSAGTNAFIRSLAANGVRYYIGGHDHMHNRALVVPTNDSSVHVQDVILASDSYKFYQPLAESNDDSFDLKNLGRRRETPIAQKLYDIGYYIVTVDSERVSVDFYGIPTGLTEEGTIATTPMLTGNWQHRETFGYSLDGREFLVKQGGSYTGIADSNGTTKAKILDGSNTSTTKLPDDHRAVSQLVTTGWSSATGASSKVLTLWGLAKDVGSDETPVYVLSLSYDPLSVDNATARGGNFWLGTRDANGNWTKATSLNHGGTDSSVVGPWRSGDALGTSGVDTASHTVWAVLNHASDFAAVGPSITGIRRLSAAEGFHQAGRTLRLPGSMAGRKVSVEIRAQDGRLLGSVRTSDARIALPASARGVVLVRARAEGSESVEARILVP